MYKEKILVTSNDVDHHLKLKISSLFKFLQQVSTNHSEALKIGRAQTSDLGMNWVITRMAVKIYSLPELNEEVTVVTHPGETMKFLYPRFYQVYDKKGRLLVSSSSIWAVINSSTRHLIPKPFGDRVFKGETSKDDIPLPEVVRLEDVDSKETRKVRYSDIDLNGHLNNTKYIEYMIDLFDTDFYNKYQVSNILINYQKECHDNDEVALYRNDKEHCSIKGEVDGGLSFLATIDFKKRD